MSVFGRAFAFCGMLLLSGVVRILVKICDAMEPQYDPMLGKYHEGMNPIGALIIMAILIACFYHFPLISLSLLSICIVCSGIAAYFEEKEFQKEIRKTHHYF